MEKIARKKKMRGLHKHQPRGLRQTRNPLRREAILDSPPQTATNTRGQSAEGKDGPPLWYRGSLPSLLFKRDSRTGVFQNSICWCDYGVRRVWKTRRQCGYADGLEASSTGGLKST